MRLSEAATQLREHNAAALGSLSALEKEANNSAVLSEQLAGLYEELDFTDKLYSLARQATRLDPSYSPGFVRLGRVEQYLGYYTPAEQHLKEAVRLAPNSSDAHFALALLYKYLNKQPEAQKSLQEARRADPTEWRFCMIQNEILLAQKKYAEAFQVLEEAARLAPGKGGITLHQAVTLDEQAADEIQKGKPKEAEAHRKQALTLAEKAITILPDFGPAWYHLGKLRLALGDQKGARDAWEKALKLAPTYLSVGYQLGQLYQRLGDPQRARELLKADSAPKAKVEIYQQMNLGVAATPDNLELRRKLARYCVEHKLIHRAIFEWEQVLERKPGDPEAKRQVVALKARRLKDMTQ